MPRASTVASGRRPGLRGKIPKGSEDLFNRPARDSHGSRIVSDGWVAVKATYPDEALKEISRLLLKHSRGFTVITRLGGGRIRGPLGGHAEARGGGVCRASQRGHRAARLSVRAAHGQPRRGLPPGGCRRRRRPRGDGRQSALRGEEARPEQGWGSLGISPRPAGDAHFRAVGVQEDDAVAVDPVGPHAGLAQGRQDLGGRMAGLFGRASRLVLLC